MKKALVVCFIVSLTIVCIRSDDENDDGSIQGRYGNGGGIYNGGVGFNGGVGNRPNYGVNHGGHGQRCTYICSLRRCYAGQCYFTCRPGYYCHINRPIDIFGRKKGETIEITKPESEKVDNFEYVPEDTSTNDDEAVVFQDD
ncbi:uncharacterized protein LOC111088644 [Limulus polyphemus]|uniref:Uncharacterized protein LOC111088644 n=1 Tax=Limulus polyphemus TaxID=6850 RepID=A0ABM1TGQ2_LIMPO|nr:uncharacterized protein LOC111088644 [Limulus polyphemus]